MRWDRTGFFFMKWDETEDESSFNEMKSNFFSVRWDRTRFIFCEMRQNQTSIWWDETEQNWDETEFSDSDLHKNDNKKW